MARSLSQQVRGRTIVAVEYLDWERMVEEPDVASFRAELAGRRILEVGRRAKWLLLALDQGWTLALHLRMSGWITVYDAGEPVDAHTHLVLALDDGRRICFHDQRKFGRARLVQAEGLSRLEARHGPEPLSEHFTARTLGDLLRGRHRQIKPLLLDQRVLAGLGNIYVDEALWEAQIHPLRSAATLDDAAIQRLHAAIQLVLRRGLAYGGSTLRTYRNGYGEPGQNQEHFNAYRLGPRDLRPCPRCGGPITRLVVGQRGTHVCLTCQPPPDSGGGTSS